MPTMKAAVYHRYGGPEVLHFEEVARPTPREHEVLIRVHATTVTAADCQIRRGNSLLARAILGFTRPRRPIMGTEFAGTVEQTGKKVTQFQPGDEVYGFTGFHLGAYAGHLCLPERASMALKPRGLTLEEAVSLVDGATTAWHFLHEKAHLQKGQRVLINGASGSIGSYALQLARHSGAEVTAVCSAKNTDFVRALGADHVLDYTRQDFTSHVGLYDVIFDAVGKSSFAKCHPALTDTGVYLSTTVTAQLLLETIKTSRGRGKRAMGGLSIEKTLALRTVGELAEQGVLRPIIDRQYPFARIEEAHRYVETGHKRGNVVVVM